MRQTQSRKVLYKLITRIKACFLLSAVPKRLSFFPQITEDEATLRQILRLRGLSLMTIIFGDYATDLELVSLVCPSTRYHLL